MKQHFILLFIVIFFSEILCAQTEATLTKQQMYEDYDEFCNIIAEVNPQLRVRKKVTGIDVLAQLRAQRPCIDTLTSPNYFIEMLARGVMLCNDGHANIIGRNGDIYRALKNDTIKAKKFIALLDRYSNEMEKSFLSNIKQIPVFLDYTKGNYYSIGKLHVQTDGVVDSLPRGAKVLSVGGASIESLIHNPQIPLRDFNWDISLKKSYTTIQGSLPVWRRKEIPITYEYQGAKHILTLYDHSKTQLEGGSYLLNRKTKGFVTYFPEQKMLYIRLPAMVDNENFYTAEIKKHAAEKEIGKVVVDIRQNGGGSDYVWMSILSAIIKDTLDIRATLGLKNTDRAVQAFGIPRDSLDGVIKIPALDNEEFLTLTWGKPIVPSAQTIGYSGKIYVLQDKMIYSSAGSLSNVAWMHKNIISMGETTGKLLGFGLAPITFTLPNSYFSFTIEPVLDLSNADTPWDYYHDNVEIPVDIPVEQRVKLFRTPEVYTKDFLFNHDPVFQKVLEQKD